MYEASQQEIYQCIYLYGWLLWQIGLKNLIFTVWLSKSAPWKKAINSTLGYVGNRNHNHKTKSHLRCTVTHQIERNSKNLHGLRESSNYSVQ